MDSFYTTNNRYTSERSFDRALRLGRIIPDDRNLIREYVHAREVEANISAVRAKKIVSHLNTFRRFLVVPYREATIPDLHDAVSAFKNGTTEHGTAFRQNTIHDTLMVVKAFFRWMADEKYNVLPEKKINVIKCPSVDRGTTDPGDILTVEEIEQLIRSGKNVRDRAFISVLYESAARVAELCRLRWKDLEFDKFGVKCYLDDTKTRKRRFVRLTMSADLLALWQAAYPGGAKPEMPVFLSHYKKELTYIAANRIITRTAEASGIEKRVHAHLFRKSRITHLIAQNYSEAVIKDACWANQDTGMLRTYIRLRERDTDREFLRKAGVEVEDEKGDARSIDRPCSYCHHINPPIHDFCGRCGRPLTTGAKRGVKEVKGSMLKYLPQMKVLLEKIERGEIDPALLDLTADDE